MIPALALTLLAALIIVPLMAIEARPGRSRSLVWPVLLIALGALFLANNLRPEIPLFRLLAAYWPFLLIAWGGLRLAEVLLAMSTDRPLPSGRLTGGEITLVVFICLIGSGMYAANRRFHTIGIGPFGQRGVEIFGEQFDYPLEGQKPAAGVKRILIENLRGNVRVTGTAAPEIRITGRKTVRAFSRSDADQANQQSPLEITVTGDQAVIRTSQERVTDERRISDDLEVSVPRGISLEARGRYGDFDVNDLEGGVDINSDNAGVRLNRIGGDVRVDLRRSDIIRAVDVKGKVELKGRGADIELENIAGPVTVNGSYSGDLEFKNLAQPLHFQSRQTDLLVTRIPGHLRLDLSRLTAANVVGPLRLTTRSRDITIEEFTESLELDLERGDVELRPKAAQLAKIDARVRSGDLNLTLPASAHFDLKATTARGEVENGFGPALKLETRDHGATLSGSVGKGPQISLLTQRGAVRISKE
jgi:hypothetical protein